MMRITLLTCAVLFGAIGIIDAAKSDETTDDAAESVIFERVRVSGAPDEVDSIPGSVTYLDKKTLQRQEYSDVHRVLGLVPGVNIQEEDGYGLRPNIGMRGSGSERSSKITTMEDGVLVAPAPYAAPSAYYFPTVSRMEGIEVRKGSSAIQHGPFTNGGVLNLISSSIPSDFGGDFNFAFGDDNTLRGQFKAGDSKTRFGWLVETYQHDTEGFKELDGGGETGFGLQDYMVKLRFNSGPDAALFQALELKLGRTEQDGTETYLGLTQADFDANPYRRYAGSQEDVIDTEHDQIMARYLVRPNDKVDITAVAYRNDFFRNWRKLQSVNGTGLSSVFGDPSSFAGELAILKADLAVDSADDALRVRNNRRDYYSQGIHAVVGYKPGGGESAHELEFGLRIHEDEEDRFQEEDGFRMTSGGAMQLTSSGTPGSQANRISSGESLALFARDTYRTGNWTVSPGMRLEMIDFERIDYDDASRTSISGRRTNGVNEWIPGIGVSYRLGRDSSLFGGIHRGFSPPGPSATDTDAERSLNYELGYRRAGGGPKTELVAFYNDYQRLLGACTVSSGCSTGDVGDVFDGGEARVFGLEAGLHHDLGDELGTRLSIPIELAYTYTHGEFRSTFDSDYDPWGNVVTGDELPYLAEHQGTLSVGLADRSWSVFVNLNLVDSMRTVAGQGTAPGSETTDAHALLDLSGSYTWNGKLRFFVQVRNATDEDYVAARRPAGARPGIDRTAMLGVAYTF